MAITIAQIKELREATAAGMGACKEALVATNGDMKEAVKYLREKGLAVAAKRVDKESKQGLVALAKSADEKTMALAEINCETDFVAKTDAFIKFAADAAQVALEGKDVEQTLNDDFKMLLTKTGENVKIRRSVRYALEGAGVVSGYVHMGKIGVLVELVCEKGATPELVEAAHEMCLHVAASAPKYLAATEIPEEEYKQEIEIRLKQMEEEAAAKGKKLPPPQIIETKVLPGVRDKFAAQVCMLKQSYVSADADAGDMTVEKYLDCVSKTVGAAVTVKRFVRFQLGA